jgi:two-component system sensor histidine kinase RegB
MNVDRQHGAVHDANAINLSWLLQLRWGAAIGQALLILLVDRGLGIALPLAPLFALVAAGAASNVAVGLWSERARVVPVWTLGAIMLADVALLTGLFALTGGPFNPFSFLYLVNIALAAVVLPPRWTWTLVVGSLLCFGSLFAGQQHTMPAHGYGEHLWMHVQGMWVAFAVAASFIVYFIQRVTRALAARDAELADARHATARHERLASLATLAAGAAHELSTPLSTIAVVAKELERQLGRIGADAQSVADARLIREQVERCRQVLVSLAADAGESAGEATRRAGVEELLAAATDGLTPGAIVVSIDESARTRPLYVPPRAVAQALRGVIQNARQASPRDDTVAVSVRVAGESWRIEVRDRGRGMTPDVLARAGEPFFTTKPSAGPEHGMGLGLFLTRTVLERVGGRLELASEPGRGTTATLVLPLDGPATIAHAAGAPATGA